MGSTYQHHRRDDEENKTKSSKSPTKDRKKWCRGKEGVAHTFVFGVLKNRVGRGRDEECGFHDSYLHNEVEKDAYWSCVESEYCEKCGKIKCYFLDENCTKLPEGGVKYTSFLQYLRHSRRQ